MKSSREITADFERDYLNCDDSNCIVIDLCGDSSQTEAKTKCEIIFKDITVFSIETKDESTYALGISLQDIAGHLEDNDIVDGEYEIIERNNLAVKDFGYDDVDGHIENIEVFDENSFVDYIYAETDEVSNLINSRYQHYSTIERIEGYVECLQEQITNDEPLFLWGYIGNDKVALTVEKNSWDVSIDDCDDEDYENDTDIYKMGFVELDAMEKILIKELENEQ